MHPDIEVPFTGAGCADNSEAVTVVPAAQYRPVTLLATVTWSRVSLAELTAERPFPIDPVVNATLRTYTSPPETSSAVEPPPAETVAPVPFPTMETCCGMPVKVQLAPPTVPPTTTSFPDNPDTLGNTPPVLTMMVSEDEAHLPS